MDKGILKQLRSCITISRYFEHALVYDSICFLVAWIFALVHMDAFSLSPSFLLSLSFAFKQFIRTKNPRWKFPIMPNETSALFRTTLYLNYVHTKSVLWIKCSDWMRAQECKNYCDCECELNDQCGEKTSQPIICLQH